MAAAAFLMSEVPLYPHGVVSNTTVGAGVAGAGVVALSPSTLGVEI